jgi:outer membrane immunogenic protein
MKKLLVAGIAAAAFCGAPAIAADMPVKPPVYKAPPPVFSWTGWYGGVNAGAHWGRDNDPAFVSANNNVGPAGVAALNQIAPVKLSPTGFAGGIQFGYNVQASNIVWGWEADIDGLTGSKTRDLSFLLLGATPSRFIDKADDRLMSTLRARVGFLASDRFLIFATAGGALSNWSLSHTFQQPGVVGGANGSENRNVTRIGWTVGGGVEYAVNNQWSVRAEYLYANFGTANGTLVTAVAGGPAFVTNFAERDHLSESIARIALNYRFGSR